MAFSMNHVKGRLKNLFLTDVNLKKVRRKILPENGMPARCDTVVAQK